MITELSILTTTLYVCHIVSHSEHTASVCLSVCLSRLTCGRVSLRLLMLEQVDDTSSSSFHHHHHHVRVDSWQSLRHTRCRQHWMWSSVNASCNVDNTHTHTHTHTHTLVVDTLLHALTLRLYCIHIRLLLVIWKEAMLQTNVQPPRTTVQQYLPAGANVHNSLNPYPTQPTAQLFVHS